MKKETKEIIENLFLFIGSLLLLAFGCIARERGQEGIGLFMIVSSLYVVLWIHAGLTGTIIEKKLKREQGSVL
ncbi:MAG: hypothetical protein P8016_13175 [Sedimentisphaerales bacterium]